MKEIKCECPELSVLKEHMKMFYDPELELPFVDHEPGKCKCTNKIKAYKRGNKILYFCSCCKLLGDLEFKI